VNLPEAYTPTSIAVHINAHKPPRGINAIEVDIINLSVIKTLVEGNVLIYAQHFHLDVSGDAN
jgi:hypothetical protein